MRAIAFAPGHISGFFEPVYNEKNMARIGSRGAGINIDLGAVSEINIQDSKSQIIDIYINDEKTDSPIIRLALKNLLKKRSLHIEVKTNLDLPFSQGFGMSAASTVSATYALAKLIKVSNIEALKASHFAEITLKTGLGDVLACCFGGIEIRKEAGLPPWGLIEHIPGKYDLVLCVVGKKLDTKKILSDSVKKHKIIYYGRYCTNKLLENPSIENLFKMSQFFTKNTSLADKNVLRAIEASSEHGMASMCMLGNSVFAIGENDKLCKTLSSFGEIFKCSVDESGARVLYVKK